MTTSDEIKDFAELLTGFQRRLHFYVCALVHRPADAEDVLQETNRVIWEKFAEYRPGTDFAAWVFKIAYFEVCTFRRRRQRDRLLFDNDLTDQLAAAARDVARDSEDRAQAIRGCFENLGEADRKLIARRYLAGATTRQVALESGRSEKAIYQSLTRIRRALLGCVERRVAREARQ